MRTTKTWICEVISRATKTVIVEAISRKDAIAKLRSGEGEGIDINYDLRGFKVVGREDLWNKRKIAPRKNSDFCGEYKNMKGKT